MTQKIEEDIIKTEGVKFFINKNGKEIARAYLFLIKNSMGKGPYGLLEDIFVDEELRGQGIGTELLNKVIEKAKQLKCYKLVATSRYERPAVHKLYEKVGFEKFGLEFKMYLHG